MYNPIHTPYRELRDANYLFRPANYDHGGLGGFIPPPVQYDDHAYLAMSVPGFNVAQPYAQQSQEIHFGGRPGALPEPEPFPEDGQELSGGQPEYDPGGLNRFFIESAMAEFSGESADPFDGPDPMQEEMQEADQMQEEMEEEQQMDLEMLIGGFPGGF